MWVLLVFPRYVYIGGFLCLYPTKYGLMCGITNKYHIVEATEMLNYCSIIAPNLQYLQWVQICNVLILIS